MAYGLAWAQSRTAGNPRRNPALLPWQCRQLFRARCRRHRLSDSVARLLGRDRPGTTTPCSNPKLANISTPLQAGFNSFAEQHPERVTLDILPVTPQDVIAAHMFRHCFFYGFDKTLTSLRAETRQFDISDAPKLPNSGITLGSMRLPSRRHASRDGSTMLMINSHQPLTGPVSWYEAHLKSGDGLNVMGGLFIGCARTGRWIQRAPWLGATVNQPDLVDVYVLDIDPDDDNRYQIDRAWLELEEFDILSKYCCGAGFPGRQGEGLSLDSRPGDEDGPRYLRGALRRHRRNPQVEQWLAMSAARNFEEWQAAIALQHIASFNFVYANADGDIHFIHTP